MEIKRSILVLHPARDMYRLVRDVTSYPQFLSWCTGAEVLEESAGQQLARLDVALAGVKRSFTTRNRLVPDELLTLSLAEGPFQQLSGEWHFGALGQMGCKVSLALTFEFSHSALSGAFRRGFAHVADKLVYDFSRRADQVYGCE
ncbi:MAG: type II toxin-antitoxin system RatA family toxin [Lysobacterales bacterium]